MPMQLKVEDVAVDSFATTLAPSDGRGTVRAHEDLARITRWPVYTCPECATPPDTEFC